MGLADMLIKLEIRYGSQESLELAASIMQIINKTSHDYSEYLAKIRGAWAPGKKMRNCQVTTCAPTGTISMLAGCSSGIEPNFQWHYNRRAINQQFVEYHPLYLEYIGSCRSDEPLPDYFVTSDQVSWEEHVKMQAAFQQHVDASISKTINMPASATVDEVKTAILMAHELGCKGLTVYRDGSRTGQVISSAEVEAPGETKEKWEVVDEDQPLPRGEVMPRPSVTRGQTKRYQVACGKLYVTYAIEPVSGQPCEVFVQSSETGGCQANTKALGMMISKALRCGMDPDVIIHTLKKVSCPACRGKSGLDAKSCPDAVARALIELRPEIMDEDQEIQSTLTLEIKGDNEVEECEICPLEVKPCPDCGKGMIKQSGCWSCSYCGFSKCG
jgi:ribonucleoside-diphosphate reductase alpha chain